MVKREWILTALLSLPVLGSAWAQENAVSAPPPPPPFCSTSCNGWEPDYPSLCAKPFVNHRRNCYTRCSNGAYGDQTEIACLPIADYLPIHLYGYYGGEGQETQEVEFKDDTPCEGRWWVTIDTRAHYYPSFRHVESTVWTECRKNL